MPLGRASQIKDNTMTGRNLQWDKLTVKPKDKLRRGDKIGVRINTHSQNQKNI